MVNYFQVDLDYRSIVCVYCGLFLLRDWLVPEPDFLSGWYSSVTTPVRHEINQVQAFCVITPLFPFYSYYFE
jgi:hypothetical protein